MHLAVATTSDPDVDTRCVSIIFMSIAGPPMTQMQFESCLHAAQHETLDFTRLNQPGLTAHLQQVKLAFALKQLWQQCTCLPLSYMLAGSR